MLSVDADERVSPELAKEIAANLASAPSFDAFRIHVPTYFMGRPLAHYGRASEDPGHIRLFRKSKARFDDRAVHESVVVDGPVGWLRQPINHFCYPTLATYWKKIHYYAPLEANARVAKAGPNGNRLYRSLGKFAWMMFARGGLLDGPSAWLWIAGQAYQEWLTVAEMSRLKRSAKRSSAHAH